MTRTYELGFIVEPRQNDDEVQAITDRFTGMIENAGSTITYVDQWGKRKLAYPIRKFQEGKYVFVYVTSEGATPPWPDIERLMTQDEKILRFLVVRTDEDIKRANRKGKVKPQMPGAEEATEEEAKAAEGDVKPAEGEADAKPAEGGDKAAEAKPAEGDADAKPAEGDAETKAEESAPEATEAAEGTDDAAEGETKEGDA